MRRVFIRPSIPESIPTNGLSGVLKLLLILTYHAYMIAVLFLVFSRDRGNVGCHPVPDTAPGLSIYHTSPAVLRGSQCCRRILCSAVAYLYRIKDVVLNTRYIISSNNCPRVLVPAMFSP
ncbi:hypothetical protein M430DRAFT_181576 [Amorphotheca resinae ATCC 22711]|uniref:Uncharacterized protein n=1 Tax=Amorphotheca resinae ATCC 22711 TaxID=857342 RepID=A0A2T3ARI3_AMORE|nr:hypothetical protein M430DRAFT_181576 [Amorphotheca resinae ATCC 22711]PSS08981.1 hypothetical protein M430DRAFT_181576 [Amorphotheca resinae ATCC 22711]